MRKIVVEIDCGEIRCARCEFRRGVNADKCSRFKTDAGNSKKLKLDKDGWCLRLQQCIDAEVKE